MFGDCRKIASALEAIGMSGGSRLPFRGRDEDDEESLVILVKISSVLILF